jgi:hypothetical protein
MEEALAREAFAADDGCESGSLLAPVSSSGIFWIDVPDRAMDARCRAANEEPAHVDEPSVHQGPPPIPPPILRALPPLAEPPVATLIEPPLASESLRGNSGTCDMRSDDDTSPTHRGKRGRRAIPALMLLAAALVCGNVLLWNVGDAPRDHGFVAAGGGGSAERETASVGDDLAVADAVDVAAEGVDVAAEGVDVAAEAVDVAAETVDVAAETVDVAAETVSVDDVRETVNLDVARETSRVDDTVASAADIPVRPVASIALPPQAAVCTAGTCTPEGLNADRSLGTALAWSTSIDKAAQQAQDQGKLVFLIHISGNFEDPGFT